MVMLTLATGPLTSSWVCTCSCVGLVSMAAGTCICPWMAPEWVNERLSWVPSSPVVAKRVGVHHRCSAE
eukprot:1162353-Amphidinium_carterae.1